MTRPRPVVHNATVMVQRRTMYRMYLLLPTRATRELLGYCLAYALSRTGLQLHEFEFLSDHYHLVLTDPLGELPEFMREFNSLTARALNASYGRWEAVWSKEQYSAPVLVGGDDVFAKCVYTLANATAAGMVRYTRDYTGLCSWGLEYGQQLSFARPGLFFTAALPHRLSLTLARPQGVRDELTDQELRREIRLAVRERERQVAGAFKAAGRGFLGMKRVLRRSITDTASSWEKRRGIIPRVAACEVTDRVEALAKNAAWLREYRESLAKYRTGAKETVFPYGTYQLRIEHGVECRPPP